MRFAVVAMLMFFGFSSAQGNTDTPVLTIYTEHFPPYNYLDKDSLVGINTDIVREVCQLAQVKCRIELTHWNRAYRLAQEQANTAVFSTSRKADREAIFQWVGPLISSQDYLFRLRSRPNVNPTTLEEATRFTLAAPRNDVYEEVLLTRGFVKGKTLLDVSSKYEGVKLFMAGKLDMIIGSELSLPYQLRQHGFTTENVVAIIPLSFSELQGNFLAVNHNTDKAIVANLNQALVALNNRGRVAAIIDRYRILTAIAPKH